MYNGHLIGLKMKLLKYLFPLVLFLQISGLSQVVKTDYVESELISEVESIQPGKPFWVALRLKMDEHWHTYWRNAGDAGLETKIDWTLPERFEKHNYIKSRSKLACM